MLRLPLASALALALAACLKPAPPPAAAPPEVVAGTSSVSLSTIPVATISAWLGAWTNGNRTLVISRAGDRLFVNGRPLGFVGLGTFADADQTSYLFGPDGQLRTVSAANIETHWTR